jgi:V/A-type H+/Na+-transporting ATPase subunit E
MPFQDIKNNILLRAKEKVEINIKESEQKAKEILEKGQKVTDNIRERIINQAKKEAEIKKNNIITEARLKTKKELLFEKQKTVDHVYKKSIEKLLKFDDKKYLSLIKKMILSSIETGEETLLISENDRNRINPTFIQDINKKIEQKGMRGNLKVQIANDNVSISGGIIVKFKDLTKNNSLESILYQVKEKIEIKINQILFG